MAEKEPTPVHLTKVLDGLAENPALPTGLVRRLVRYRRGFGHVAKRADLTLDMIGSSTRTLSSDSRPKPSRTCTRGSPW
ncbi:hypothetical protein ML5_5962 [Micromonospora sp. L5]|uniref:hypothetical protein n=1 Tax=Micromonospora TaxID=1873 RepID=UPI0001C44852|nr:hypothetical protein [Micromonospora sp. L5]ADU11411.1 hypothetical protein ML5_5962 [Micromonospora sp. L5]